MSSERIEGINYTLEEGYIQLFDSVGLKVGTNWGFKRFKGVDFGRSTPGSMQSFIENCIADREKTSDMVSVRYLLLSAEAAIGLFLEGFIDRIDFLEASESQDDIELGSQPTIGGRTWKVKILERPPYSLGFGGPDGEPI